MSGELRVGIIGCGRAAERLHAPALARSAGARLTAVADPRAARAELIASGVPECRIFEDGEELLESGWVDAVIVANPPGAHLATVRAALGRDISVLVEKPLATDSHGLEELARVERDSRGGLQIGFNRRYWEPARRLHRLLSTWTGEGGRARMRFTTNQRSWGAMEGREDPLHNLAPHQLDLARYLFGREIESVSARWKGPETIEMTFVLSGDVRVEAEAAHAGGYQEWARFQLDGRSYRLWSGSKRFEPADGPVRLGRDLGDALLRRFRRRPAPLRRSYDEQLAAFVADVRDGRQPSPGLNDGVAAVRVMEAARRSAAAGGVEMEI